MAAAAIPLIGSVASGLIGFGGSGRAGKAVANANIAAEHGVLDATKQGQEGVQRQIDTNTTNLNTAGTSANSTLDAFLKAQQANLQPGLTSGTQGNQSLQDYVKSSTPFSFNPTDLEKDPGYQFELAQGSNAIQNSASSRGLLQSGNALQDLTKFGQGLAQSHFGAAFGRAKDTFDTNQNTNLQNFGALINSGIASSGLSQSAYNNFGAPQAQNTVDIQKFLASLNTGGTEFGAGLGLQGANDAGKFAVGAGQATGAGILGGTNALTSGSNGVANSLPALLKALKIPGFGG